MAFPLFNFITKNDYKPDTNGAAANLVQAEHNWANERQAKAELEQRKLNEANQYNLQAAGEQRLQEGQKFGERKTKAALLDDYTTRLSAGDYAGAAAMAPQLKMLGVEPVLRAQNEAPAKQYNEAGPTEEKFQAQAIPPLLMKQMGGAMPQQPSVPSSETLQPEGEVYDFIDTATGEKLGTVDTGQFKAQAKEKAQRIGEGFKALPLPEGFPAEQITEPAATEGEQKFAIGNAMDLVNNAMRHPHGKGGATATGAGFKEVKAVQDSARQWLQAAAQNQGVKKLNEAADAADSAVQGLDPNATSLEARAKMADMIKHLFPGAIKQWEYGFIAGGMGEWKNLEITLNKWVAGGQLPADFQAALRGIAEKTRAQANARQQHIAQQQADSYLASPEAAHLSPEQKQGMHHLMTSTINSDTGEADTKADAQGDDRPGFLK